MQVIRFLNELVEQGNSAEQALAVLKEQHGINNRPYDNCVVLDYDQINSTKTNPFTRECRGLIVSLPDFRVISRKFDRFFNYGEFPESYQDLDISRAVVLEKADGSLIGIYRGQSRWEVSTRGTAFAEAPTPVGTTYRQSVQRVLANKIHEPLTDELELFLENNFQEICNQHLCPSHTYIFEYCGPDNRIVTRYEKPHLAVLGIRENATGAEPNYQEFAEIAKYLESNLGARILKQYSATDLDQLVDLANNLTNLEEGFVVWDPVAAQRVKIKSKTYLAAHRLRGNNAVPTRKQVLEVTYQGEASELLAVFPEFQPYFDSVYREIADLELEVNTIWNNTKDIAVQKDFALQVKDHWASGLLFGARSKKTEPMAIFNQLDPNKQLDFLDYQAKNRGEV